MHCSTCPACGYETLETIELEAFNETDPDLPARRGMMLFECVHCMWQGSTSALNVV